MNNENDDYRLEKKVKKNKLIIIMMYLLETLTLTVLDVVTMK